MTVLRFVDHCLGTSAGNMAIDEALLRSVAGGRGPVLRFYGWEPFTLSFGYSQSIRRIVDVGRADAAGVGLVRRMTGGKMVFHARELTFFLAVPLSDLDALIRTPAPIGREGGGSPTFLDRFRFLVGPFVAALQALGLDARFADPPEQRGPAGSRVHCYQAAAGHSVFLGGRKLIGAAGVLRAGVMAIHGSIPLARVPLPVAVFLDPAVGREGESLNTAYLGDQLAPAVLTGLSGLIAQACSSAWRVELQAGQLTDDEREEVGRLVRERYSRLDWKIGDPP